MPHKRSRRLVIDADVARSAGGKGATHPVSKSCRSCLEEVLRICHKVVMTDAIADEWDQHQSNFARGWRRQMVAKKKLDRINAPPNRILRNKIERAGLTENKQAAMIKDVHLIEAAGESDKTIISLDETVRACFREIAASVGELRNIVWANPTERKDAVLEWLEDGAKPERKRTLSSALP